MSRKSKKLGLQKLEEKALMAGDVAVSFDGTTLSIDEAADSVGDAQQVQMYKLSNGGIRVQGLGDTRIQTQGFINGNIPFTFYRSYVDYYGVGSTDNIDVDLGGGNDSLTMLNYNGGINANLVTVDTGAGNDRVSLSGLETRHELRVDTHSGKRRRDRRELNDRNRLLLGRP